MTDPSGFGSGTRLTFHSPISDERASRIVRRLTVGEPTSVVDYGCGWSELLLRTLETVPLARGTGIDLFGPDVERGRASAAERGLT